VGSRWNDVFIYLQFDLTGPNQYHSFMRRFEVLFDRAEPNTATAPPFDIYGPLGFPEPPPDRPWVYTNFVQSLDGVASLRGRYASGGHISQSEEDRWLMDLLRAHADALMIGMGTLVEEKALGTPGNRGPIFRIVDDSVRALREQLGRGRERNWFVTGAAAIVMNDFKVFDDERIDTGIVSTRKGAARLVQKNPTLKSDILIGGDDEEVNFPEVLAFMRRERGVRYLLCEGGPTLNGSLARADLIDERFVTVSPVEIGLQIPVEQELSEGERAMPPQLRPKFRPTTFGGPGYTKETATWWEWMSCRKVGDHQFNRYRRRR
jgi:riboflavin biosynthesis pyrimidine reductase